MEQLHFRVDPPQVTPALGDSLNVAFIHDWLTGMRGGEKCLEALCERFPNARIHTLLHKKGSTSPTIERHPIQTSPLQWIPGIEKRYRSLLPLMPMATRAWHVGNADLVFSLSHCVAKAVKVPAGVPHLCYCFTPMRYAWEGRMAYLESWQNRPLKRAIAERILDRFAEWDRRSAEYVTQFIAISQTVADRIKRFYHRDSVVIAPPVDVEFNTMAPVPRDLGYLVISALVPYKKIEHTIQACTALGRKLTVIGEGPERARLEKFAGPTVQFLGWQPNEVLREHYRRCSALLFPGVEDFGIVPIEALACGAPVIALGKGGVAETVDDSVGLLYDSESPEGLAQAIQAWEAVAHRHDPDRCRAKALKFATPIFTNQIQSLIHKYVDDRSQKSAYPPHARQPRSFRAVNRARETGNVRH